MSHTLRSIRFYVNDRKDRAAAVRDMLAPVAAACGLDVVTGDGRADAVLALGGDGTMLRAVHEFPGVPLLGLNLGGLGYLASVGEEDFSRDRTLKGEFVRTVNSRVDLDAETKERIIEMGLYALLGE